MKELSLNVLDIAQNSIHAGAKNVGIYITEEDGIRTLTVTDDGKGMSPEFLATVTDPFTTTRTTRPVGLGLPLLKLAAEQAGGEMSIISSQGEKHGTRVSASFEIDNIDCVPLGDIAGTMVTILQGSPEIDFDFVYKTGEGEKRLNTKEMRELLGDVPINDPAVLVWAGELLREPFGTQE